MYDHGYSVTKNFNKAFQWYLRAANQDVLAQNMVGLMYENGRGVTQDLNEAFKWFSKAAEQGHIQAKENIERLKPDVQD